MYRVYKKRVCLATIKSEYIMTYRNYYSNLDSILDIPYHFLITKQKGILAFPRNKSWFSRYKPKFLFAFRDVDELKESHPELFI